MVPLLFPGMPGAVELVILLIMMGLFLVVPLALIVAAYLFGKRRGKAEMGDSGDS
ncbi:MULTISPECIES: hypothetical protein [Haloarcula]|uniref:Uncharacterized protein n=2 Tax=Haloarcula vallismortis TaxID=28442 RepID=M0JH11_HALVA|nr:MULTISPECIES: hypothetical protein [Haloarcula]EMA07638.1 hypothetical protein C437_09338 [Haloarcula vallismortis ATCC 29715]SDW75428.1 hypothetical protein SAMN05443574_106168 [Haloarcula vallismortis]